MMSTSSYETRNVASEHDETENVGGQRASYKSDCNYNKYYDKVL